MTPANQICCVASLILALGSWKTASCDDPPKADAAPDPCVTDLTLEKLDSPPQRKTKFVRSEEPLPMTLNVKLLDQKFAAYFALVIPNTMGDPFVAKNENGQYGRMLSRFPEGKDYEELRALERIGGSFLLRPTVFSDGGRSRRANIAESTKRWLAQIPPEHPPVEAAREFFASAEIDRYLTTSYGRSAREERTFRILAPTAEEAEQRAKTLLTILDQGFSRPIQLWMFKQRQARCDLIEEQKRKVADAEGALKMIGDELQKYAEFTPDVLPGVRAQQFQADAELAGLKAKIEAYEKLLKQTDRYEHLAEAKVATEVELIGCEARRAATAAIIAKIKMRGELMEKQSAAEAQHNRAAERTLALIKDIQSLDHDIAAFGPVRLVDDQVSISAVEWVRAPERNPTPAATQQP